MDDTPAVPAAGRKIQQRRLGVLELDEEFQRIFSGGAARLERLRPDPAVPFLKNMLSGYFLLHRRVFPTTAETVEDELTAPVKFSWREKVCAAAPLDTFLPKLADIS